MPDQPTQNAIDAAAAALPEYAVEVRGLDKRYAASGHGPAKHALVEVDLAIPRGALFGLLGPNGAGKSTLINILAGLVNKSGGSAAIWGFDIERQSRRARAAIGVVPQETNIDPFFTPREMLELQAGLYVVRKRERRTDEILAAVGLTEVADSSARQLSGGMRRRLLVAKAMVHAPPVLVLDEPTAGVDIELRQQFWSYVGALNADGTTILLTTHYLEEAERVCDSIAIIHEGELVANETTRTLIRRLDRKTITIAITEDIDAVPEALARFDAEVAAGVAKDAGGAVSLAVFSGSEVIWAKGYGWANIERRIAADARTIGRTGSISKSFTAVLMMQLV